MLFFYKKEIYLFIFFLLGAYAISLGQQTPIPDSIKVKLLFQEGMEAYRQEDWDEFRDNFTEAKSILEKEGPWDTYITSCRALNKYYNDYNYQYDSILKYSELIYDGLKTYTTERDESYYTAIYDVGGLRIRQGSYNQALQIFQEVYDSYKRDTTTSIDDYSTVYQSLGLCYREKGDYDEALRFYDRAIDILEGEASISLADRYNMKAKLLYELKRAEEAKLYYKKAIGVLEKGRTSKQSQEKLLDYFISLAKIAAEEGNEEQTYLNLDKAEALQKLVRNDLIGSNDKILRQLHFQNEEYEEALEYQEKAEKRLLQRLASRTNHPNLIKLRAFRVKIYERQKRYQEAVDLLQENLSALTANWKHSSSFDNPKVEEITQPIYSLLQLRLKARNLYLLYQEKSELEILWASLEAYKLSVQLIEQLRKDFKSNESTLLLAEISSPTLEEAMEVAWETYQVNPSEKSLQYALDFMEVNKAALLQAALQDAIAKSNHLIPQKILTEESELEDKITDLQRMIFLSGQKENPEKKEIDRIRNWKADLFHFENKKQELVHKIEKEYPEYYDSKYSLTKTSLRQLKNKLSSKELLLEYYWGEKNAFLLALGNKHMRLEKIPLNAQVLSNIEETLNSLKNREKVFEKAFSKAYFQNFSNRSLSIYQHILAKTLTQFPKKETLIIIPDGLISYLPFSILLGQNHQEMDVNYAKLPYLLYEYNFSYSFSARIFAQEIQKPQENFTYDILTVAPSYQTDSQAKIKPLSNSEARAEYTPLKFNQKEAEVVQEIWKGINLNQAEATESIFRELAPKSKIIHLAMHASADDENPMFSKMVLGNRSSENTSLAEGNILYAQEIIGLDLKAELVVLSACDTGYGKLRQGEGIQSLARAFAFAGCPSISMSLWKADDESVAQIMQNFHHYLKAGEKKSSALSKAKRDYLQSSDRAHPYFWAAFMTIGYDAPISGTQRPWKSLTIGFILLALAALLLRKQLLNT